MGGGIIHANVTQILFYLRIARVSRSIVSKSEAYLLGRDNAKQTYLGLF